MHVRAAFRLIALALLCLLPCAAPLAAQADAAPAGADLQYVVILSRHGVRSFLGAPGQYDKYSAAPWPHWDVPTGYLTAHGYQLMKLMGAWDRAQFTAQGVLPASGCDAKITILADTDERTLQTGKALAEGMLPGCNVPVHSLPAGTVDPLFSPLRSKLFHPDMPLAAAAIAGRIGGDANNLTEAYRPQLTALDRVLAGCGRVPATNPRRLSILDIPASLSSGSSGRPAGLRGPLVTASSMVADMVLEYTQGMSDTDTAWGCIDGAKLRALMQIDTAAWEYGVRTPVVARMNASNLLDHIEKSMEQSVTGKPVAGAIGKPGDRILLLVGHDTNIATVAGALNLSWIIDGRVNDTPPGGALRFELWRPRNGGQPFVRIAYVAQTLEQMRAAQPLTPAHPPAQAEIIDPACGRADLSCTWPAFDAALRHAIDPAYVAPQP